MGRLQQGSAEDGSARSVVEVVRDHLEEIRDKTGYSVPAGVADEIASLVADDLHDGAGAAIFGAPCWSRPMPAPSGQIPPPWAWWENETPATRAARRPVPGSSRRVFLHRVGCHR